MLGLSVSGLSRHAIAAAVAARAPGVLVDVDGRMVPTAAVRAARRLLAGAP